jgi:Rieske Fe-S protein
VGDKFFAVNNTCLHRGGPLGQGELHGVAVTCPWHGWQYDMRARIGCGLQSAPAKILYILPSPISF